MQASETSPTSTMRVVSALTELILSGELPAGSSVRELDIAERLGTSRTPVREAIAHLVARGWLTKDGGRSARVQHPTLEDVLELYELRTLAESYLAGRAATSMDDVTLGHLAKLEEKLRHTSGEEWHKNHVEFHATVFRAADRPRFNALVSDLRAQADPYVRLATRLDATLLARAEREHTGLLEAMRSHDSERASHITESHLQETIAAVERVFQATQGLLHISQSVTARARIADQGRSMT